jgi:hypothetical protein
MGQNKSQSGAYIITQTASEEINTQRKIFMRHKAKELIRKFIDEKLAGDISRFLTFDFKTLRGSAEYGGTGEFFDCDETRLMRAVYQLLWGEHFPGMEECGKYRGDTMNSFHTMFGREIEGRPGFFAGVEKYAPSEEFREKVRHFGILCSNLGNFLPLPHWYACGTTLNFYRGTNEWRDFFDLFLIELHKVLCGGAGQDETLCRLVQVNGFFFDSRKGEKNFKELLRLLFLEDYCGSDGMPRKLFPCNFHWRDTNDREQYFHDANIYLDKTQSLILSRCSKMISALDSALN